MNLMRPLFLVIALCVAGPALSQDKDLTKIKERELEAVREKISVLKVSMDKRASERDRITGELQSSEVLIAEKRSRVRELERQRSFSEKKRADLSTKLELKRNGADRRN